MTPSYSMFLTHARTRSSRLANFPDGWIYIYICIIDILTYILVSIYFILFLNEMLFTFNFNA